MENTSQQALYPRNVRDVIGRLERIQREVNYLLADLRRDADQAGIPKPSDGRRDYDLPTPDAEQIMAAHGIDHDTSGTIPEHVHRRIEATVTRQEASGPS